MKAVEEDAKERTKIRKRNEAEAEKLKGKGNDAFKEGKFTEAISNYTLAINKCSSNPVLYTNRAQVNSMGNIVTIMQQYYDNIVTILQQYSNNIITLKMV